MEWDGLDRAALAVRHHTSHDILRALDRRPVQRERRMDVAARVVVAWSGLRGAVSLATALALPRETDAGAALAGRT